jgi:hypothetical protein
MKVSNFSTINRNGHENERVSDLKVPKSLDTLMLKLPKATDNDLEKLYIDYLKQEIRDTSALDTMGKGPSKHLIR